MTRADDILNQIDAALGDGSVGPDAVRCGPAPEEAGGTLAASASQVSRMMQPAMQNAAQALQSFAEAVSAAQETPPGVWVAPADTALGNDTDFEIHD
jgi:hypothetical protein